MGVAVDNRGALRRVGRVLALVFCVSAAAGTLAGCGGSDTRYYISAFEQNQELRELFRLFNREKDQENRFVLISRIAAGLASEGRVDREILFLTTHAEKNPADIYNGYYLLLVADAYRDMKESPLAIHYYRRILSNYGDLLVKGGSIHLQCLQELLAIETDPSAKIGYYKELFSRFPNQSSGVYWYEMAKSYEALGEWEQSIQAYQTCRFRDIARRLGGCQLLQLDGQELAPPRPERAGRSGEGRHPHQDHSPAPEV
jgi:tetratricopeptide (TPR) repeat protein